MKKIFNKTIFEENARRLGLKLTPVSDSAEGGIFFKENLNDEFKKLTFDNFFKKNLLRIQVKLTPKSNNDCVTYKEIVEYTTEILEERYFNVFYIMRTFRIGYDITQSYINEMLENGVITEVENVGIGVSYKVLS
ncbi:hypothetical protein [Listeria ivanovii]|uniref:hypothetical protein n=1 Tax=Listeria ivanovii TaxID=1638 RepID=UPI001EF2E8C5|nr:hypothetical protein [Listeria ivanovii]